MSDEHYIPTLLAARGLDNETSCMGGALLGRGWDPILCRCEGWHARHATSRVRLGAAANAPVQRGGGVDAMRFMAHDVLSFQPATRTPGAGGMTHTLWEGNFMHPKTYEADEVDAELLAKIRCVGACRCPCTCTPAAHGAKCCPNSMSQRPLGPRADRFESHFKRHSGEDDGCESAAAISSALAAFQRVLLPALRPYNGSDAGGGGSREGGGEGGAAGLRRQRRRQLLRSFLEGGALTVCLHAVPFPGLLFAFACSRVYGLGPARRPRRVARGVARGGRRR